MGLVCVVVLLAEGEQDGSGRGTPESWRNRVRWRLGREWGGRGGLRLPCVRSPHPLGPWEGAGLSRACALLGSRSQLAGCRTCHFLAFS